MGSEMCIRDRSETGSGVFEIKCPYSINGQLVNTMEVFQIVELGHREFCLEMSDQGPRLRRCSWCDFVVWTPANRSNCFIERIYFDEVFVSNILPKLVEFFILNILQN